MEGKLRLSANSAPDVHQPHLEQLDELRQLYEQAPCGYHSLDENGVFIQINQTELTMLGYGREEVVGKKKFSDLLTPESQQLFRAKFPKFKQKGRVRDLMFQMIRKDGSLLPVSLSETAIRDAAGNYLRSRSVVIDISDRAQLETALLERQQTEVRLRQQEEQLRLFVRHVPVGVAMFDRDMRYIVASDRWLTSYGLGDQDLTGRSHYDVFPDLPDRWKAIHQRCLAGAVEVCAADPFPRADGSMDWVRWEIHPWRTNTDEIGGIIIFSEVITERKQAEQKVQEQATLLDIATEAIYVCDLERRIIYWNQGAERLYGWPAADVIGQSVIDVLRPQDPSFFEPAYQALKADGTWQGEVQEQTKANQTVIVEMRCTLVRDEAEQPKAILVVSTNVTEKKQLEAQFLRAQRLESLGTLASGIAHDLNNVLTPIIGIVQLLPLQLPNLDQKTQRLLQILNESTHRGAGLVKQILSFTRGIEGKSISTQISHLLREIQKIIRETFPKDIEFSTEIPQNLWLISADTTLLHQVFMNLCVNARDAMPDGGQLSIIAENLEIDENYARMHLDAQSGFYVAVTVADTGMGIPRDVLDRISIRFLPPKKWGRARG